MMDELKQQFYEVMHKYQKPFSEEGVTANLTQWYEQKQGLLQLLRRHPLWNEKELAIVFRVEERREIDRATVDETRAAILELGRRACTDDTVYENFETALRASTADYARIPNEYRLDTIRQYGDIKCAPGQKASRIINRLCLKFHLDQIEEEAEAGEPDNRYMRTVKPYNALFARLADALNPAHIEKTAVLSIHPCDFLEMSNRDNTWSSCHCLEGGGYRGGCQSYMGDAVSMIFFTVSDEYTQDFHTAPRITREIFCYKDNVLLQSRLYPTNLEDQKTLYRSIVQQAIATCLDKLNLWSIKRGKEAEPYGESATDSNHYPDYKYGYAVASLLKGETDYIPMTIGSVARCVCCGGEQKSEKTSMRTRDRIRQIVSSGHFAGGFVPYGYRAINKGRVNKRDQPVKDLEINPDEAAWVREVFTKVAEEGASGYAMAQMLNQRGLRTRQGAEFQSSNIKRIIQHEGYTGYIITKAARSEFMPQLQIIDEALFAKAAYIGAVATLARSFSDTFTV